MLAIRNKGRVFEYKVLGRHGTDRPRYLRRKLDFQCAIQQVMGHQPHSDPFSPSMRRGLFLVRSVRSALRLELQKLGISRFDQNEILGSVGLYDALNTEADFYWETDAIIACSYDGKIAFFTLDLKNWDDGREYQRQNHFLLTPEHFTGRDYFGNSRMKNVGGLIADSLISQLFQNI